MWVFNARHDFGVETDPTQGEFFVNNEIDRNSALVRETIQNSLDARRPDAGRVEVRFTFHEGALFVRPGMMEQYLESLVPHLRASGIASEEIDFANPRFLVVEDFGTHGLRGDPASKEASDFYYFWHVVGRSGKSDSKGGRWGLGKTVFPNSSQISAFFGYTIRSDDGRHLLFGQTSLKTHELGAETFLPHAFYQSSGPRQFELPFDSTIHGPVVHHFHGDFRLSRVEESGLSIVIPFPYAELTEPALVEATIEHYFYPILSGDLVVRVNERVIEQANILTLAANLQSKKLKDAEKAIKFAAEIQQLPPTAIREVDFPGRLNTNSVRIPSDAFAPDQLAHLRHDFREGKLIALKVPVLIKAKTGAEQPSFVTVFLKRDEMLYRGHDFYIRSGITLSGQSVFGGRPALGLMLAEDAPVCRFLGDAENPAHTLWNPRSPRLAARYRGAADTVRFLREAMVSLLDTLTQVAEEEDRSALAEFFFTPRKQEPQPHQNRETPPPEEKPAEFELAPALFALSPLKGGFRLKGGPDLKPEDLPLRFSVLTAYEIRRGNPFKKYDENDYRLESEPIRIQAAGVEGLKPTGQRLEFTATAPDFDLAVSGFDVHRDLKLMVDKLPDAE
jgi:hypothetical protein